MNIAFWVIVVAALALIWLLFAPSYKKIGQFWKGLFDDAKREMSDDESDKYN